MLVIQTVDCDWKCKWENNAKQRDKWTSGWCAFCHSGAFLWISLGLSARGSHRMSRRKRRPQSSESSKIINPQSAGLMMFLQTLHVGHLTRMTQQWSGPSGCFLCPVLLPVSSFLACNRQTHSHPEIAHTHTHRESEREFKAPFIHSSFVTTYSSLGKERWTHQFFTIKMTNHRNYTGTEYRNNLPARRRLSTRSADQVFNVSHKMHYFLLNVNML